jgi:hypothetical protein
LLKESAMRYLLIQLLGLWIASVVCVEALAQEKDTPPIATVLGQKVFEKDLRINKSDKSELRDFHAIAAKVMRPLITDYIKKHDLAATPEEVKEYREALVAVRKAAAEAPNSTPEEREASERMAKRAETPGTPERQAVDLMGKQMVEAWKFNRALHEKYGGRVVAQQLGPEPLDAYHDWLEEEARAGRFTFNDAKWRTAFWEYYNPKHHVFIDVPEPFEVPFWLTPVKPAAP